MARLFLNKNQASYVRNLDPLTVAQLVIPWLLLAGLLIASDLSAADTRCDNPAATLESIEGVVEWAEGGSDNWQSAQRGSAFCYGDKLRVLEQRAAIRLANDTVVRLQESSVITLMPEEKASGWN